MVYVLIKIGTSEAACYWVGEQMPPKNGRTQLGEGIHVEPKKGPPNFHLFVIF